MKQLIALAAIAAIGVAAGDSFSVEDDSVADGYIQSGAAKLDDTAAPPAPGPAPSRVKSGKARVLVDCAHGKVGDVVSLAAGEMKEALAQGYVDNDPAAVAYAASLPQNQPKPSE